jgi:histidinol-phosphate aminotransferase
MEAAGTRKLPSNMMSFTVPDYINKISPYVPGKPLETLFREYGIDNAVKLASNENPIGPSPKAIAALQQATQALHRYPDGAAHDLVSALAEYLRVDADTIVLGNGSDEIISMLVRVFIQPGDEILIPDPSFLMYAIVGQSAGARLVRVPLDHLHLDLAAFARYASAKTRMVFLCNPNNPTGTVYSRKQFEDFLEALPRGTLTVVDEAYFEFVRNTDCPCGLDYLNAQRPVITMRTFSKIYGLAGLRVGYAVMPAPIAELLQRVRLPFNVSSLAQAGAIAAIQDQDFLQQSLQVIHDGLDQLCEALDRLNVTYFATEANFFLIDVARDADQVYEALLHQGVIVRSMTSYGFPQYIRVNVGLAEENERFIESLKVVLNA